jgi:cell division protein FtsZ
VMLNAGAAVMGSAETRGENRARKAAEGALSSPLLDNRDIMGAKKILLSIISGEEAELQMDELTEITEYIQSQAGDEAEMIFGHGVDPDLGDRIRVTVIATGFHADVKLPVTRKDEKKVHELDRSQGWLFSPHTDNSVNEKKDLQIHTKPEIKQEIKPVVKPEVKNEPKKDFRDNQGEKSNERELIFSGPFNRIPSSFDQDDDGEDSLLKDDDFNTTGDQYGDQIINDDGMMELRNTRDRLQQQAQERKQQLIKSRKSEMTKEEFNEKWSLPAYLRRGIKMQDVPHSSEPFISKYNLNDDNNLLGNNKFLHDNVD